MVARRSAIALRYGIYGLIFGFCLSRIGFTSYDELHQMFVFSDLRLLLAFMGAVGLLMVGLLLATRNKRLPRRSLHPGTIVGGLLFGLGWAVTGACPGVVLVQIGEGQLAALVTLGGILFGNWLYGKIHARFFRWDLGSCDS